jgi:transposase
MFDIKPKTLYHWYRNHLSDYKPDIEQGKWLKDKIPIADQQTGEILSESPVYIAKPENLGKRMTLDDKQIGKDVFSIMTNRDTGKIALMVESAKAEELQMAVEFLGTNLQQVQSISCDMSPSYLKFIRSTFSDCTIVIDKFHVIRYVLEAVQNVRIQIKNQLNEQLPKGKRTTPESSKILSDLELLRRSKYLLAQSKPKWTAYQTELATQLFEKFPQLQTAYQLAEDFKTWYTPGKQNKGRLVNEKQLFEWYEKAENSGLKQFEGVIKMLEKHENEIINYFDSRHTNAKAENMNGKIQRFISNNYGIKDKDFNLYRIARYFS